LLLLIGGAQAQPRDEELAKLRARIDAVSQKLEQKEGARREARDALRDSERAISQANRRLAALQAEERALRASAGRIGERRREAQRRLAAQREALERMLAARAASPGPDALRVALSGDDPAAIPRQVHYASYVSQAAAARFAAYRGGLGRSRTPGPRGRGAAQPAARGRAGEPRRPGEAGRRAACARGAVLDRVALEVRASRRGSKCCAPMRRAWRGWSRNRPGVRESSASRKPRCGAPPSPACAAAFAAGARELTGRFGAQRVRESRRRASSSAHRREPVKAIAAGQVVFADWMRGFGNLLIVDHGDAYLSIYANNESLLKQVGEIVTAGEPVATTGSSGGNEETGLYFEMRHLGRAFDPLRWVRLK
jgi:septal ring factor EnvC (AmiA/AmiB activator)